jgi:hypothetical protein
MDFKLPDGIDEKDLVRDKFGRAGHWYHAATDSVISCPLDWAPEGKPAPVADKPEATPVQALVKANTLEKLKALATEEGVAFAEDATKEQIATAIVAKREAAE